MGALGLQAPGHPFQHVLHVMLVIGMLQRCQRQIPLPVPHVLFSCANPDPVQVDFGQASRPEGSLPTAIMTDASCRVPAQNRYPMFR